MNPMGQPRQNHLADFKVGVDNVIFSVDTHLHRLLVLLVKREDPE